MPERVLGHWVSDGNTSNEKKEKMLQLLRNNRDRMLVAEIKGGIPKNIGMNL